MLIVRRDHVLVDLLHDARRVPQSCRHNLDGNASGHAMLPPQTLRELWQELDGITSQRYRLTKSVDELERAIRAATLSLTDTVKQLEGSGERINASQLELAGFGSGWSRFRNRDTIDTLHKEIDQARVWMTTIENRAAALRTEITDLGGARDRTIERRDTARPAFEQRTMEIRSALDADASLRSAVVEQTLPQHLRGIERDSNDVLRWRATVGRVEQYRHAYGIDGEKHTRSTTGLRRCDTRQPLPSTPSRRP